LMPWVTRGLKEGVVTTRYPRHPDGYGPNWRGAVVVSPPAPAASGIRQDVELEEAALACPTGAITVSAGRLVQLDRGRCILCGICTRLRGDVFRFDPGFETAELSRDSIEVRKELSDRVRALRRSVHIRHIDAGSDGSDESEVAALSNPVYDVQRLGIFFTASPRHADVLLVTGAATVGMADALRFTYDAMPAPKVVIAAGVDAASGGVFAGTGHTHGGVGGIVPVDVWVPGSPASPFALLHGILVAIGLLSEARGDDVG
jgi:Ni,Fe-hydrogenase III small subunit/ferredoxin